MSANYSRRPGHWRNDPELAELHKIALRVACSYCRAPIGKPCTRLEDGSELVNLPCHPVRETDAFRRPTPIPPPTREDPR